MDHRLPSTRPRLEWKCSQPTEIAKGYIMVHHSPPKYYCERFTDKEGKIIGINIHTLKHFKTTPKNVCGHNNLYRIGNNDHSYEKHLARLEGMISNDYPKSDAKDISYQNIAAVIGLMARIYAYSPNSMKYSESLTKDVYAKKPEFRRYKQFYELRNIHAKLYEHYAEKLKGYSFLPVTSTDQEKFITSDNPIIHFFHADRSEYFIFPIDSTHILIGTACPLLFTIKNLITPPIINSLLVHKANNYVYMPDYQCEIDVGGYNMTFQEIIDKELSLGNLSRLWYKRYFIPKDMRHHSVLLCETEIN